jgi:hypothetical protein
MSKILTNRTGNIRLELKDDRLSAWLTISDSGRLSDEQDILYLIEEAGIKTGFDEAVKYMRKHGMEKDFNISFPVAICNRVQGETKLNYFFNLEQAKQFDGRITPQDMAGLTCVEQGTVVADYSSNIFDRQGSIYDIYGEMLHDEQFDLETAKDITGSNVSFDLDRRQYIAECPGYPSVDEQGRISILDKLVISGDVHKFTDVLRSPVTLEVQGNLQECRVSAAADIIIRGDIINSAVNCGNSLKVTGQIVDCRTPGLEIGGDIRCGGVVDSRVLCRGRIDFAEGMQNSEVVADRGIYGREGWLRGGHYECSGNVEVASLGDPAGILTEVEITISSFHKAILMQLTKESIRLKRDSEINAGAILELNDRISVCEAELDRELNTFLKRPVGEKLRLLVTKEVQPPVRVRVLKHEYLISDKKAGLDIMEKD